jgi:hypothetical protein
MTDKGRRIVSLVIASLVILVGLWLCVEVVWRGKMGAIFWIGPFLVISWRLVVCLGLV